MMPARCRCPPKRAIAVAICSLVLLSSSLLLLSSQSRLVNAQEEEEGEVVNRNSEQASPAKRESGQPPKEGGEVPEDKQASSRAGQLTVIAPKYLRSQSDYHVLINLANSSVPATIDLQLIGARDSNREQVEAKSILASPDETQTVKFEIGADWPAAEYVLSVSAQAIDKSWNFTDEKPIIFQAKTFSIFIQTDKAIYKPGQLIQFRALFLAPPTLAPKVLKNSINVTIENPKRAIIKQWNYLSNYRGLLSLEMPLSDDPMLGEYTIKVSASDQQQSPPTFVLKQFSVAEYVLPTFDVSIDLPPYATHNESDISVSVRATYTYGKPVAGHVTLTVQPLVRFSYISTEPLEQAQFRARLAPDGKAEFQIDVVKDLKIQVRDYFEREIEFFALVEEDLTGRTYNKTESLKLHESAIKIERLKQQQQQQQQQDIDGDGADLKPGLRQIMRYKVAYQDDTPVEDNGPLVELKYEIMGHEVATFRRQPVAGLIEHELLVPAKLNESNALLWGGGGGGGGGRELGAQLPLKTEFVDINASYRQHKYFLSQLRARHSESNQHLQIVLPQLDKIFLRRPRGAAASRLRGSSSQERRQPDTPAAIAPNQISAGEELKVVVRATEGMQQVTCQGLSRGDIVWALSRSAQGKTEFEFDVKLESRMAPEMRILCFYVRPDNKELIADSRTLIVLNGPAAGRNLVKLAPSRNELKPGQQFELGVFTKPNSLVGVLGLDQSVLLLKSGNDLSSTDITNDLKSYGAPPPPSGGPEQSEQQQQQRWPLGPNTESLFESAHVVVLTNNRIYNSTDVAVASFFKTIMPLKFNAASSSSIQLSPLVLEANSVQPPEFHLKKRDQVDQVRIRTLFPETWLWENGTADSNGQLKFSARVPDSITSWQLSAFSLNEAYGLALSQGKTLVRVFKPFFVRLNLPYSIIRGETVVIQAIVFDYATSGSGGGGSSARQAATVTLENKAGEFEFVETAENAIDEEKYSSKTSQSRRVQLTPNEGVSVSFLIRPTKIGNIDIRVIARGELSGDGESRKLLVKAEGQTQHFNKAKLIRLPGPQSTWRQNISIDVPANAVPGSRKVYVSAIGDILGAGLSNLDDLLRLPYGCGEQNMINLVPNIVILNYLQNSRRLRDAQRDRAKRNIEVGYQRQLNYRRQDGSFSAFGPADANGSVWLTAYVLKTLKQAKAHITIDEDVLNGASQFIARHSMPDGSIEEVGMLHHKELASSAATSAAGGAELQVEQQSRPSSVYLTAYALAALLEGGQAPVQVATTTTTGEQSNEIREVLERGLAYLEQRMQQMANDESQSTNYELAMTAYVLELASGKHQEMANRAYEQLWSRAMIDQSENDGELVHWSLNEKNNNNNNNKLGATTNGERDKESTRRPEPEEETGTNIFNSDIASARDSAAAAATEPTTAGKLNKQAQRQPPLKPIAVQSDQSAHLFMPSSLDVEITSWALLTAIKRNELDRALPIVRWLVSQQNSRGGFASTQDTVLAIQALSSYAEASSSSGSSGASLFKAAPQSIDVEYVYPLISEPSSLNQSSTVVSRLRKTSVEQVLISQTNALVAQQNRLPDNITWVQVQATGVGQAVVQVSWQYNLLVSAERPAFYLNPTLDQRSSINYLQLSVCTFYKGLKDKNEEGEDGEEKGKELGGRQSENQEAVQQQQQQQQSNMAVCEIELPSGYVADLESLPSLKRYKQIKRVDTLDRETKVLVYLDRVTRQELCFTIPAHRSSMVANNKPVPVTIYDYYDRKKAARIFYEPHSASSCDVCAAAGACGNSCARDSLSQHQQSTDKSSGRSLREQRLERLKEQEQELKRARLAAAPPADDGLLPGAAGNYSLNGSERRGTNSSGRFKLPDAYQLLPLSAAFSTLNEAARNANFN